MTLPFNYETLKSSFDKHSTLLNQLKDMEDTFSAAGLTGIEVVDSTDTSLKLKMTFADGSSFTTSAIDIKGAKGDKGDTGDQGPQGDPGEPGGITNINGYTGPVTTGNGLAFNNGALSSYDFNLTDTGSASVGSMTKPANVISGYGTIYKALNSGKTIGKLYGYAVLTLGTVSDNTPTAVNTGLKVTAPAATYNINAGTLARKNDGSPAFGTFLRIDTEGDVYLYFTQTATVSGTVILEYPASIYFFEDFGDTPQAQTLSMRMNALNPIESEER